MSETKTRWSRWTSVGSNGARVACAVATALVLDVGLPRHVSAQGPTDPSALLDAAVADFERGRIDESVAKFNQLVTVAPRAMPQLWQRGIALYYAGRYDDCRKQ